MNYNLVPISKRNEGRPSRIFNITHKISINDTSIKSPEIRLFEINKKEASYSLFTIYFEAGENQYEDILSETKHSQNNFDKVVNMLISENTFKKIISKTLYKQELQSKSSEYSVFLEGLIEIMKMKGFLTQVGVEIAIRNTPRHLFVPHVSIENAYKDIPLGTKKSQTISQPSVVARMTEWLDVKRGQKILEIGSGSGWQSAILGFLVDDGMVFTVERHKELVEFATDNLKTCNVVNVNVNHTDGTLGLEEKGPFDRIIITAACEKIPEGLDKQLNQQGLIVAPVGRDWQHMVLLQKTSEGMKEIKKEEAYVFAPLLPNVTG